MLVHVRTSVDLRIGVMSKNNKLYQLKVGVGMLNTVKTYCSADVSIVNPSKG